MPSNANKYLLYGSAITVTVASLLQLIALVTPGWSGTKVSHYGLWQMCGVSQFNPTVDCVNLNPLHDYAGVGGESLQAVRALETMSFLSFFFSTLTAVFYAKRRENIGRMVMIFTAVIGGSCAMIGIVIFSAENFDLYYSFALSVLAGIFGLGAAGLAFTVQHASKSDTHVPIQ